MSDSAYSLVWRPWWERIGPLRNKRQWQEEGCRSRTAGMDAKWGKRLESTENQDSS